ncbi:hypothetical protein [Sphingomonas bacterium]|uniref:hypothetical protein n=1 Tax=Sphingomonas bacterium TaxID=1895847 RepID=UPI0020C682A9|nr:hypothetical protein [Sphingomonas bacterium]
MNERVKRALVGATALGMLAGSGGAQLSTPPKARYYMDVSTATGPLTGGLRAILKGGGESRSLTLRLGSTLAPDGGAARADHFLPPATLLGASVPLATPIPTPSGPSEPSTGGTSQPGQPQRPKGRLLIYWGCGAHAGPGQPVIIDFGKIADGQMPPNIFSTVVPVDNPPSEATSRTYGFWPGPRDKHPQPASSLVGDHRIAGNYTPTIGFALQQDWLAALHASVAAQPDGSGLLSWNAVPGATGYYAWAFTGAGNGDAVCWASSTRREFGGALWDYVAPTVVARLVTQGIVLPPSATSCQIPAEVKAGGASVTLVNAFGPEADFAYPPRPTSPKVVWHPDWTAKVRYKSTAMVLPSMGAMTRGANGQPGDKPTCKPKLGGMLGGMLGGRRPGSGDDCR